MNPSSESQERIVFNCCYVLYNQHVWIGGPKANNWLREWFHLPSWFLFYKYITLLRSYSEFCLPFRILYFLSREECAFAFEIFAPWFIDKHRVSQVSFSRDARITERYFMRMVPLDNFTFEPICQDWSISITVRLLNWMYTKRKARTGTVDHANIE